MKSIKEVALMTGISVRTLQYYDEIGVFKPTAVTKAGYRMYDEDSLDTLQQILFFKELDFSLKDIKLIMGNPHFDKNEIIKKQKTLLKIKRDRLNRLLDSLEKIERGEQTMCFKEFDISEYIQLLEQFKKENMSDIIKYWGNAETFDKLITHLKEDSTCVAQEAIRYYGSVENYVEAMKVGMSHFSENMEKLQKIKEDNSVQKNLQLMKALTQDTTKDIASKEIQDIVEKMMNLIHENNRLEVNQGDNYWNALIDGYLHNEAIIETFDKRFGKGASNFMGRACQYYIEHS